MGEIKTRLNISKITAKNLIALFLLATILAVVSAIAKLIGGGATKIDTAQAQGTCWTQVGGGGEGSGCGGCSEGCDSSADESDDF